MTRPVASLWVDLVSCQATDPFLCETISDIAVLADQPTLFGPVASDSTCWRLLDALDQRQLGVVAGARARAREVAWEYRAFTRDGNFRHPSWRGLRPDSDPADVRLPPPD